MKNLEVHLNWKWFLNYFDILKSIYHTGYFLIRHQEIVCWKPTFAEAFQEGMKRNGLKELSLYKVLKTLTQESL